MTVDRDRGERPAIAPGGAEDSIRQSRVSAGYPAKKGANVS
jgi:hypothetical protein